jgi:CDP-diacylglycerol---glycerol-3-phosphate 3-phosphatidyltransferase
MEVKINKNLLRNLPNFITLARVVLIFYAISCLFYNGSIWGIIALLAAFLLDGVDGVLARKLAVDNKVGSFTDTLGDRITENTLLVFLAYKRLIPLFVPLIFISRSFISDFIRFLAFQKGIGTFLINTSCLGRSLVASKTSRTVYLFLKFSVFILGAFIIVYPDIEISKLILPKIIFYAAVIATLVNLLRFMALLFDARKILRETFFNKP